MTPAKKIRTARRSTSEIATPDHLAGDFAGDEDSRRDHPEDSAAQGEQAADIQPVDIADDTTPMQPPEPDSANAPAAPRRFPGAPKDGIVLAPGEPVRVRGLVIGGEVHLSAPVYRAVLPQRSHRWVFQQLYARGAVLNTDAVQVIDDDREEERQG